MIEKKCDPEEVPNYAINVNGMRAPSGHTGIVRERGAEGAQCLGEPDARDGHNGVGGGG